MIDSQDKTSCDTSGLLLVGHGTRDERGLEEAQSLAGKVQALCPQRAIELCFLEMAAPDITAGVERLVRSGVRHIRVMPLLLLAAGHVKRDIPAAVEAAVKALDGGFGRAFDGVRVDYCPPFGCHELVVELSERRYREALRGCHDAPHEEPLLILVARGNRDPQAQRDLAEFAECLSRRCDGVRVAPAYLAMAEPLLDDALTTAAAGLSGRIVVLPHFLFAGELLERLHLSVASLAAAGPHVPCVVAQHLGPSRLLAEAVVEISGKEAMSQQPSRASGRCIAKVAKDATRTCFWGGIGIR